MTDTSDLLVRFLLPDAGVRGVHVQLSDSWREILSHASYPPNAMQLLGEACVASALFTGHTKIDGRLSIQLRSSSALRTLFAECTAAGTVRGIAQLADGLDAPAELPQLGEDALLAITIENPGLDPREPQRYQSLVALQGPTLDEAFEDYFRHSEQLPTRLLLAADGQQAAGLLLQKLPGDEGDQDGWTRAGALFDTLHRDELLSIGATDLLHRLFHEEGPELVAEKAWLRLLLLARAGGEHAAVTGGGRSPGGRRTDRPGRSALRILRPGISLPFDRNRRIVQLHIRQPARP